MPDQRCKNPTCDRPKGPKTYCSRECQLAMRTVSKGKQLPDLWLPMSVWHRVRQAAELEQMTISEFAIGCLTAEAEYTEKTMGVDPGWEQLSLDG